MIQKALYVYHDLHSIILFTSRQELLNFLSDIDRLEKKHEEKRLEARQTASATVTASA